MSDSQTNWVSRLEEGLAVFLWREWAALGVLGTAGTEARWIIDPEILLLLTSEIARHDARLFDEVLDWLRINSRWINTQRLRSLHIKHDLGDGGVLAAVARVMMKHDPATKWGKLSQIAAPREPAEPLFFGGHQPLRATVREPDPDFATYGLLRPTFFPRSVSQPVAMSHPCALQFRLRALFGLGMRADVLCYLLTRDGAHPSAVARDLGYSQKRVQDTMVELAVSECVRVRRNGRLKIYEVDQEQWSEFLVPRTAWLPRSIDWLALARGLTTLWRGVWATPPYGDDYVASSKMRKTMRAAKDDLHASTIGFDIENDRGHIAEAYLPVFLDNIERVLTRLNDTPNTG
jgi:hypothetical protein